MTIEIDLDAIARAAMAATPGPWEISTIRNDGDYGGGPDCRSGFDSQVVTADGKALFDTLNSDAAEIHEDYNGEDLYAWDDIGRRNTAFVAAAHPAVVLELVRRLRESERDAARYKWLRDEASASDWSEIGHTTSGSRTDEAIDADMRAAMGEPK